MFLAYKNDIPNGTFHVLKQKEGTQVVINNNSSFYIQHNICPHQGSKIRLTDGQGLQATCPYHGWTWNENGDPVSSGTVGHSKGSSFCKNTHKLKSKTVYNWNGFLFSKPIPLDIDISGNYKLMEYRQDLIKSSYIPVMDLFLDIDHIPIVHPGVYDKIDIPHVEDITWKTWEGGSAQIVYGDENISSYWKSLVDNKKLSQHAAWIALYPSTMFEWQPGAVFIMVNRPVDDKTTISHVWKYRDCNYSEENWQVNEQVWEEAWQQDKAQAEALEPGWRLIPEENLDLEKKIFRSFLKL
jgi:phenylpropionate dioxygenase-like ring-hydroxylating dioxygenase large terminal subunit